MIVLSADYRLEITIDFESIPDPCKAIITGITVSKNIKMAMVRITFITIIDLCKMSFYLMHFWLCILLHALVK